jgi:hypothetical protein
MADLQSLSIAEFKQLSSGEQRRYLRNVAEHLAEISRIHAEMTHPRVVPDPDESGDE